MRTKSPIYGLVLTFVLLLQVGVGSAQDGAQQDPLPDFQYRYEVSSTYRYLVEDVDLINADWHALARKTGKHTSESDYRYDPSMHVYKGGDLKDGSGIALVWRYGEYRAGPMNISIHPSWYRTLTIHLPELAAGEPVTLDLSGGNDMGAAVFWTFSGHYRESCFAYPTGGTVTLRRIPDPAREIDSEGEKEPEIVFVSVVADLDIRFDEIVTNRRMMVEPGEPDCPAFALNERVIFYKTPLEHLTWQQRPEDDAEKAAEAETRHLVFGVGAGLVAFFCAALLLLFIVRRRPRA